jgi:hypothetical protein
MMEAAPARVGAKMTDGKQPDWITRTSGPVEAWRVRAEQLRTEAEVVRHPVAKRGPVSAAKTYERMADRLERISASDEE